MKVSQLMKSPVTTVKPRDSACHARELMEEHRINQLPVVVDGRLVGIVTDRDLRDAFPSVMEAFESASHPGRAVAGDPKSMAVEDIMTAKVVTLGPGDSVTDTVGLLRRERIGSLPILEARHLVGILTRTDILDAFVTLSAPSNATELSRSGTAPA